jgi:hypothetical protein
MERRLRTTSFRRYCGRRTRRSIDGLGRNTDEHQPCSIDPLCVYQRVCFWPLTDPSCSPGSQDFRFLGFLTGLCAAPAGRAARVPPLPLWGRSGAALPMFRSRRLLGQSGGGDDHPDASKPGGPAGPSVAEPRDCHLAQQSGELEGGEGGSAQGQFSVTQFGASSVLARLTHCQARVTEQNNP